ncbi:MAG: hydantoinase/oxoprolinase family protein [Streptosporangiaceae bacterium]
MTEAETSLLVGIDIGGTFSDVVALGEDRRIVAAFKVPSTLDDPARAVLAGLARLDERLPGFRERFEVAVFHGTTVATNALIQKRGARTALLTTEGCRDVLELRRQARPDLYRLRARVSPPLVDRGWRLEVDERLGADGQVIRPLDPASVREAVEELRRGGVESLAICFLHAYADDAHERATARLVREALPDVDVSVSSELCPEFGEYERTSTVVANAYVSPQVRRYLRRLGDGMGRYGVRRFHVVKSNGGLTSATNAERHPFHLIESGPAAGIAAAAELGRSMGVRDLIAFDMGGTTAKVGVVHDGLPRLARELHADRYVEGEDVGGYVIRSPVIDLAEIGAGGGSVAWLDPAGVLKVGPHSAGSDPGPACYGRGGEDPTVTDAHVVVGTLADAGSSDLRPDLARDAIEKRIARPLSLTTERAAHAILEIATAHMAETVRLTTVRRGIDPRGFALVAFGGAGPLHAAEIARDVGVSRVVIPPYPGMFSAIGALMCEVRYDLVQSVLRELAALRPDMLTELFDELERRARALVADEAVHSAALHFSRHLDLRHAGQLHQVSIALGDRAPSADEIEADFRRAYNERYGYRLPDSPVEVVAARLEARYPLWTAGAFPGGTYEDQDPGERERRVVGTDGRAATYQVLTRAEMTARELVHGPALIEDAGSVVRVLGGQTIRSVDEGVLVIDENG